MVIAKYSLISGIGVTDFKIALIFALLWGVVSLTLKPLLLLFTLPINILTLGLFTFVLNALLFWSLATTLAHAGLGLRVDGFIPALEASFLLSVVGAATHSLFKKK